MLVALVLTLLSPGVALACRWCDHGPPPPDRPGLRGPESVLVFAQPEVFGAAFNYAQKIGLTDTQFTQLAAIRSDYTAGLDPLLKRAVDLRREYERVLRSFPIDRARALELIGQMKYTQIAIEPLWIRHVMRGATVLTQQQMKQLQHIVDGRSAAITGMKTHRHAGGLGRFLVLAQADVLGEELIYGREINITSRQSKTLLGIERAYQKGFLPYRAAADQAGQELDQLMHAPVNGLPFSYEQAEVLVRRLANINAQLAVVYTDAQIKRSKVLTARQWLRLTEIRAKQPQMLAAVPAAGGK